MHPSTYRAIRTRLLKGESQTSLVKAKFLSQHVTRVVKELKQAGEYTPKLWGTPANYDQHMMILHAYMDPMQQRNMASIAREIGISRERVRQILKRYGVPSRGHFQRTVRPLRKDDPQWKYAGRNSKAWQRWRERKPMRRAMVHELRALAQTLDRTPTTKDITDHFHVAWQQMAYQFLSRRAKSAWASKGLRRWYHLAGLTVRPPGGKGHVHG